ncbi:MAG: hypothetical protein ACKVZJ_01770 [Phycisphaerales bacterium]
MSTHDVFAALLLSACAGSALAGPVTAILQDSGVGANSFANPGATIRFNSFDRPVKSGTGGKWIMLARNTGASTADAMYITGAGASYNLAALEGTTAFEPGRTFETADRYVDINESGDWVGIGNLVGGATNDDEVVYRGNFTGSSLSIAAREGQTYAGDLMGTANYGPGITDSGAVSFGYSIGASSTAIGFYTGNGTTRVLRDGELVTGSATPFSTANFSGRNAFQTTSDGSSYVVIGNLGTSSGTQVLVKDDAIVLRAGDLFGGRTVAQINGEQNILQDNGDWLTRVRFSDGTGGAIKNGTLVAASGDLVGGAFAGERWSELPWTAASDTTFAVVTGDTAGNLVLGGFTDNTDTTRNFVWTFNGTEFMRTGDQLDLTGDGTLDDAFLWTDNFASASPAALGGFLADDGWYYSNVTWRSASGTVTGDAFVRVLVPTPGAAGLLSLAGLAGLRRRRPR